MHILGHFQAQHSLKKICICICFPPYFLSMGRLYSSQSQALAWGGDGASPQVTALCFGIFGARVPFFWFWLPGKKRDGEKKQHQGKRRRMAAPSLKFNAAPHGCRPYLKCCCCLCLSCGVSLLCCDHGSGCRGWFWGGSSLRSLEDALKTKGWRNVAISVFSHVNDEKAKQTRACFTFI